MKLFVTGQIVLADDDWPTYYRQGLSVCTKPCGYKTVVFSAGPNKAKYFCRVLMNCPDGLEVDHIDGNTLNNQRSNLRIVTSQQNKFNTAMREGTNRYKGVNKHGSGYKAVITIDYKSIHLGTFPIAELAASAYKRAADKFFGDYAVHNSRK
jgi:hypothetical protein